MQTSTNTKILIVDDDKMSGELLQKRLQKQNFVVDYVDSGEKCLELIASENHGVDLILLDLMMPGLSGKEVMEKVRESFNNYELPIIIVTAKDGTSDVVDSLKGGANDYLTKPINLDIAIARINTQTNIKHLFEKSLESGKIETINKMVTTLNHEINNPLMIAYGNLSLAKNKIDETKIEKALKALDRITGIVKKIDQISAGNVEEVSYSDKSNMYKI